MMVMLPSHIDLEMTLIRFALYTWRFYGGIRSNLPIILKIDTSRRQKSGVVEGVITLPMDEMGSSLFLLLKWRRYG